MQDKNIIPTNTNLQKADREQNNYFNKEHTEAKRLLETIPTIDPNK